MGACNVQGDLSVDSMAANVQADLEDHLQTPPIAGLNDFRQPHLRPSAQNRLDVLSRMVQLNRNYL